MTSSLIIHFTSSASLKHGKLDRISYYSTKPHLLAMSTSKSPAQLVGGGGLAVIHRADISIKELPVPNTTSLECLAFTLSGSAQLQAVLIYRPPKASASAIFLSELSELLTSICSMSPSTLLLGDFNIHVDSPCCTFASDFLALLDCFNFEQHVHDPTHAKGHTLDLVCTTGTSASHLQCLNLALSNHHPLHCAYPPPQTTCTTDHLLQELKISERTSHNQPHSYPPGLRSHRHLG